MRSCHCWRTRSDAGALAHADAAPTFGAGIAAVLPETHVGYGFRLVLRFRFLASPSAISPHGPSTPTRWPAAMPSKRRRRGTLCRAQVKASMRSSSMTPPFVPSLGSWFRHSYGPGCSNPRRPDNSQIAGRNIDPSDTREPHRRSTFGWSRKVHPRGCTNSRRGIDLKRTTTRRSRVRSPHNHDRSRRCNMHAWPRHIACSARRS